MLAICQLIIINLLPDQCASFCIAIAYIYRTICKVEKEVPSQDTREQYLFNTLMLKSQVIACITSLVVKSRPGLDQKQD